MAQSTNVDWAIFFVIFEVTQWLKIYLEALS